jgi:probable rRNA maturation factor
MSERRLGEPPLLDILQSSPLWDDVPEVAPILRRAMAETARVLQSPQTAGELAIMLTDDAEIGALNRRFRGANRPTNVLAFPAPPVSPAAAPAPVLGDIVIAFETAAAEARAEAKPFAHHVAHLGIHGLLHLMGYDHQCDQAAAAMEQLERKILSGLGIPDPYRLALGSHTHG